MAPYVGAARPTCDCTPSASAWPSPRQSPGPSCPYPSDRTPPDATMKRVDASLAWSSPSDLDNKKIRWAGSSAGSRAPCPCGSFSLSQKVGFSAPPWFRYQSGGLPGMETGVRTSQILRPAALRIIGVEIKELIDNCLFKGLAGFDFAER